MMENSKTLAFALAFGAIGAVWRRWFGMGGNKLGEIPRIFKYLALFMIVVGMYWAAGALDWTGWRMYAVAGAFAYHWSRSHGDYFHVWDTSPDEGRIKWIDCVLRLIYGEGNYYDFQGNVTGLLIRYTSTACLVAACIPDPLFLLAGALTAASYVVFGKSTRPTEYAEYLAGALNFVLLFLCL